MQSKQSLLWTRRRGIHCWFTVAAGLTKCSLPYQAVLRDTHAPLTLITKWLEPSGPSFLGFKGH